VDTKDGLLRNLAGLPGQNTVTVEQNRKKRFEVKAQLGVLDSYYAET
jgi:hypothetical protein